MTDLKFKIHGTPKYKIGLGTAFRVWNNSGRGIWEDRLIISVKYEIKILDYIYIADNGQTYTYDFLFKEFRSGVHYVYIGVSEKWKGKLEPKYEYDEYNNVIQDKES